MNVNNQPQFYEIYDKNGNYIIIPAFQTTHVLSYRHYLSQ